jgi:Mrp family chromosome partitioning ATPase
VVIVTRSGVTTREALSYAMDLLRNVRADVLGVLLNDMHGHHAGYGYGYGYQYYYAPSQA